MGESYSPERMELAMRFPRTLTTALVALAIGFVPFAGAPAAQAGTLSQSHHYSHVRIPAVHGAKPVVTGDATVGSTLTADPGVWTPSDVTLTYQWFRGDRKVKDATAATYAVTAADLHKRLTVKVTGSKDGYRSASRFSKPTARVDLPALTTVKPVITGTAQVGSVLTADPGAWGPAGVVLTYQWFRGGHRIAKAKAATYTLVAKDWRQRITVKVTGKLAGYATASRVSLPTAKVSAGALTSTPVPTITGTAAVGQVLTAVPGTWGPGKVRLTYQWYRSGVRIHGAHHSTYKVRAADAGATLTVAVTGWKYGYQPIVEVSSPTAAVA